jgi:hypothetical protein
MCHLSLLQFGLKSKGFQVGLCLLMDLQDTVAHLELPHLLLELAILSLDLTEVLILMKYRLIGMEVVLTFTFFNRARANILVGSRITCILASKMEQ